MVDWQLATWFTATRKVTRRSKTELEMIYFVLSRLLRAIVSIFLVVAFAFVILRLSGDPALSIMSVDAPPEAIAAFRESWGLDQPLWVQFFRYFSAIAQGNLGQSMRDGQQAAELVIDCIPVTLRITVPALILELVIGISAGIYAARYRNSWIDRIVMVGTILGFTVPSFVLGLVLVFIFSVTLDWLPSGGDTNPLAPILPIATLVLHGSSIIARFTRSAMLGVLGQPYIRTALSKGVSKRRMVYAHALPNAAIPIVTVAGFMVGSLIAGSVVVETVFSWPGIGQLLLVSVASRDLAVVQAILLLVAAAMVFANLVVDLLYGILDPRLRAGASQEA